MIEISRGYLSGNHRLWGVIVTTKRWRQFFIGIKTNAYPA